MVRVYIFRLKVLQNSINELKLIPDIIKDDVINTLPTESFPYCC